MRRFRCIAIFQKWARTGPNLAGKIKKYKDAVRERWLTALKDLWLQSSYWGAQTPYQMVEEQHGLQNTSTNHPSVAIV